MHPQNLEFSNAKKKILPFPEKQSHLDFYATGGLQKVNSGKAYVVIAFSYTNTHSLNSIFDASLHKKLIQWSVVFNVYNKPLTKTHKFY